MWKVFFYFGFHVSTSRAFLSTVCSSSRRLDKPLRLEAKKRPSLIVFDLDATLWSPELYQLRRKLRNPDDVPRAHHDVKLYEGAQEALTWLETEANKGHGEIALAVASRTKSVEWAYDLLDQFGLKERFADLQIFAGDKKRHFTNIHRNLGIPYNEMLFFDDARDGKFGNCVPVSELGVLCCHCPSGIESIDFFHRALDRFHEWDGSTRSIIEWDGSVTQMTERIGERLVGYTKKICYNKGYGFIHYGDLFTRDLFFHFNDLPVGAKVEEGDEVSFVVEQNKGKLQARDIEINQPLDDDNQVTLHAFSMNLPFAALLANGYKDLESRNGTMFLPFGPGTLFLLHVGQRTYPDGNRHMEFMKSGGLSDKEIEDLKSLPSGFEKGMVVAILEIGDTFETTVEERSHPDMQRRIGAYGADSGTRCTEIRRVEYLKTPVPVRARAGVFKISLSRDAIPDGWLD